MTSQVWHIVIVDDSPDDRAEARRLLLKGSDHRYVFFEADTGAAGIRALAEGAAEPHRCIVLDYNLPDMAAPAFLTAISGSDGAPAWPVVVFTGGDSTETGCSALRAGAHDYVGKDGLTPQVLVRAVENATERWAMARELRQQTAAARASEQYFEALAQATSDIAYRMSADWSLMHPLEGRALVASNDTPLAAWAWLHQNIPADEHARVRQAIGVAKAQKALFSLEHRVLRPDGSIGWTLSRAVPVLDAHGTVLEWFGAASDITERKRADQALREAERNYRALAEASAEVPYRMSADWSTMLALDGRGLFASAPNSLSEWSWVEQYLPRDEHARVKQAISDAVAGKSPFDLEHRLLRADGSTGWVRSRAVPVLDENKNLVTWFGAASDITERKQAEQALIDRDAQKDEFLATLAHELRSPLAPLRTGLQVLKLTQDPDSAQRTRLMMERQLGQMVRLIDDLLDISRITHDKVVLRLARIELQAAVHSAIEAAQPLLDAESQVLQVDMPAEPIWLQADPTRISQVVNNLLTNAAKYSPQGSRISLGVQRDGAEVVVTVADQGEGIPQDMLAHVFDMFTQVDRTLDRAQGGLGIGLALVKRLVEMHGGAVSARSAGLGSGSTFTLRLPMPGGAPAMDSAVQASAVADTATRTATDTATDTRLRVLVVDDNIDSAESLAEMMALDGHDTRVADSGPAALALVREFKPTLVFMDIGMPGMSGHETARRIRADDPSHALTLVALTGWGAEADRAKTRAAGFDLHFTKPLEMDELDSVFQHLTQRRSTAGD